MHRRRSAGLAVIVVAALASAGTSAPVPTPPPTIKASLEGTFELAPDSSVAVQEFVVRIPIPNANATRSPEVSFNPTALLSTADDEQLRLRVVGATPGFNAFQAFRSVPDQASRAARTWPLTCSGEVCEGRFALIGEWEDPAAAPTATIDWRLDATVNLWSGIPAAGQPPIATLTAETVDAANPRANAVTATGAPMRFDERDRIHQWRVTMQLGGKALDQTEVLGWPLVTTGLLTPTREIIESPPDGDAGSAFLFVDNIGDQATIGFQSQVVDDVIEFEPSWICDGVNPCTAEYIVGLTWPDVRPGGAIEAGWNLDARAIGVDGQDVPISVSVEPAPAPAMATGSASGTLVWSKGTHPEFRYLVTVPTAGQDDGSWDDFRIPSYGILRATMRSTGTAPLPADFAVNFGRYGGEERLTVDGGEVVTGFMPIDVSCHFRDDKRCRIERDLAAGFSEDKLPAGWEFTIDWELEIGIGTTDPAGGTLKIVDITNATPKP